MKVLPTMGSMYSGSLRGITAAHNKGGLYFRGRSIPTNPNTARQQLVRSVVGGLTLAWSNELSEAQREGWRSYAANVPVTDSLGQSMTLSGFNWFVKCKTAPQQAVFSGLAVFGPAAVDDAPVIFNTGVPVVDVTTFDGVFTTPPGTLAVVANLATALDVATTYYLYIAPPQTAGKKFYKGPYQLAAAATSNAAGETVDFGTIDLSMADEWVSATVPVVGWDELYVPLKIVGVAEDLRRSEEFRMLVQFSDATP